MTPYGNKMNENQVVCHCEQTPPRSASHFIRTKLILISPPPRSPAYLNLLIKFTQEFQPEICANP